MTHTVSDQKRTARDAEDTAEDFAHQTATVREDFESGWNRRMRSMKNPRALISAAITMIQ
jgi:hypothetical protein